MGHIPIKLHQFPTSSFQDFVRKDTQRIRGFLKWYALYKFTFYLPTYLQTVKSFPDLQWTLKRFYYLDNSKNLRLIETHKHRQKRPVVFNITCLPSIPVNEWMHQIFFVYLAENSLQVCPVLLHLLAAGHHKILSSIFANQQLNEHGCAHPC